MESIRKISMAERVALEYLISLASLLLPNDWQKNLLVQKMNDGEMGSFLIFQDQSDIGTKRKFGKQASEYQFIDDDDVPVLVTLNLDEANRLFELDVWKANYKPVIKFKLPS